MEVLASGSGLVLYLTRYSAQTHPFPDSATDKQTNASLGQSLDNRHIDYPKMPSQVLRSTTRRSPFQSKDNICFFPSVTSMLTHRSNLLILPPVSTSVRQRILQAPVARLGAPISSNHPLIEPGNHRPGLLPFVPPRA